jgi:hypothetical protein
LQNTGLSAVRNNLHILFAEDAPGANLSRRILANPSFRVDGHPHNRAIEVDVQRGDRSDLDPRHRYTRSRLQSTDICKASLNVDRLAKAGQGPELQGHHTENGRCSNKQ